MQFGLRCHSIHRRDLWSLLRISTAHVHDPRGLGRVSSQQPASRYFLGWRSVQAQGSQCKLTHAMTQVPGPNLEPLAHLRSGGEFARGHTDVHARLCSWNTPMSCMCMAWGMRPRWSRVQTSVGSLLHGLGAPSPQVLGLRLGPAEG